MYLDDRHYLTRRYSIYHGRGYLFAQSSLITSKEAGVSSIYFLNTRAEDE